MTGAPSPAISPAATDDVGVPPLVWMYEWLRHYYLERWGDLTKEELTEFRRHVPYLGNLEVFYTWQFWVEWLWVAWPVLLAWGLTVWYALVFSGLAPMPGSAPGEETAVAAANPTSPVTITLT